MNKLETVLALAEKWRGQREKIVDVYNAHTPLPRGYRVKYEDALCATYVSALFIELGMTDIVPPECGAMQLARNMAALGRFYYRGTHNPAPGDLIFWDWQGDNWVDHVGIVTEVRGGVIVYSHIPSYTVTVNECYASSTNIRGYGVPDYGAADTSSVADAPPFPQGEGITAGDWVTVKAGAKWYGGGNIASFVFDRRWQVISVSGDRAVLGMDEKEEYNIQSPIRTVDLMTAEKQSASANEPETVTLTVTLPKSVYDRYGSEEKIVEALSK